MPTTIAGAGNEAELDGPGECKKRCVAMMRKSGTSSINKKRVAMMTIRTSHAILLLVAVLLAVSLEVAEGRRNKRSDSQRRNMKSRAGSGKDFSEFLLVIGGVMACVITPVFVVFLHSLYKDPAVPELARAGWKALKDKTLSYLGQQAHGSSPSYTPRPMSPPPAPRIAGTDRRARNGTNNTTGRVPWAPGDAITGRATRPPFSTNKTAANAAPDRLSSLLRVPRRTITSDHDNRSRHDGDDAVHAEPSLYDYASYGLRDRRGERGDKQSQHQRQHHQQQQPPQYQQQQQHHQHHQHHHQRRRASVASNGSVAPHSSALLPRQRHAQSSANITAGGGEVTNARRNRQDMGIMTKTSSRRMSSVQHALEREGANRISSASRGSGRGRGGSGGGGGGSGDGELKAEFYERGEGHLGQREARWGQKYHPQRNYHLDEEGRDEVGEKYYD